MVVQLQSTCTTGNFSISTPSGTWSGPTVESTNQSRSADFSVSTGVIRYVSPTGSDGAAGSFSAPWRHPYYAAQTLGTTAGNVVYIMTGTYDGDDGQGWGAALTMRPGWSQGTALNPDGMIGYPGQTAQIGCETSACQPFAVRMTDTDSWTTTNAGYWTWGEITFRSNDNGSPLGNISGGAPPGTYDARGWRFVGNDVASPTAGNNASTPFQFQLCTHSSALGNWIHDIVPHSTSRLNQALYLSTDANYIELGWNEIYNNGGRGGIQTHSSNLCYPSCSGDTTGFILHDLLIHDNVIHQIQEEGILIDTVDPSVGSGIRLYNNVVYAVNLDGNGSDAIHMQLSGDFNQTKGDGNSPPPEWWYNNTVYCNTAGAEACWGSWFPDIHPLPSQYKPTSRLANNIFYSVNSVPYLAPEDYTGAGCGNTSNSTACPSASGNNNIMYGNGVPTYPSIFSNSVNQNPLFVNAGGFNFALQSGSPAIGAGLATIQDITATKSVPAPKYDVNGLLRP